MVALLYALGIFQLGMGAIFSLGALVAPEGDEAIWTGTLVVLAYCSLCLGMPTIAVGWILDRVLQVKKSVDQLLYASVLPAAGLRPST